MNQVESYAHWKVWSYHIKECLDTKFISIAKMGDYKHKCAAVPMYASCSIRNEARMANVFVILIPTTVHGCYEEKNPNNGR